jgi:hypothetical protein
MLQGGLKHFIEVVFCQLILATRSDDFLNKHLKIFLERFKIVVIPHIVSVVQPVNRFNRSPVFKHKWLVSLFVTFKLFFHHFTFNFLCRICTGELGLVQSWFFVVVACGFMRKLLMWNIIMVFFVLLCLL